MKKILSLIGNSKNILVFSIVISFIIIAFSIFYHSVVQQIECKRELNKCLDITEKWYDSNWALACKNQAKDYQNCIKEGNSPDYCLSVHGKPDPSPECSLHSERAEFLLKIRRETKGDCYKEYSLCVK